MIIEALRTALLYSAWQITLIAVLLWSVLHFIPTKRADLRYLASLGSMYLVPAIFIATILMAMNQHAIPSGAIGDEAGWLSGLFEILPIVQTWFIGVLVLFARRIRDWHKIRSLKQLSLQPLKPALANRFQQLQSTLGIGKTVFVGFVNEPTGPCTFGYFKPVVLLPLSCLAHLSPSEIEAILAHELAHIKRADYLHAALQAVINALFFYHPGIRYISRQISREREHACDDLAASILDQTDVLARSLLKTGLLNRSNALLLGSHSTQYGDLANRVRRLLNRGDQHTERGRSIAGMLVLTLVICTGLFLARQPGNTDFAHVPAPAQSVYLTRSDIISMKDDICDRFNEDGIYYNPIYGGRVAANVVFSERSILMNGQPLPHATHKAVRDILDKYGISPNQKGHLRFHGPDVNLVL